MSRQILVKEDRGIFRLEIPDDAKVTFGPAIPGPRAARGPNDVYALRVYKGATEKSGLLAVFPGIHYFHEVETICVLRPTTEDGQTNWQRDDGWFEQLEDVRSKLAGEIECAKSYGPPFRPRP